MEQVSEIRKHLDLSYEQIKLSVMANLFRLVVDVYGPSKAKAILNKVEGEEIVIAFPALKGAIVIRPQSGRILTEVGESETAIARINFKVKDEKIYDVIEDLVKSSQRWGLFKFFFKYILWGKVRIHGSLRAITNTFKALRIGDNEMYKK